MVAVVLGFLRDELAHVVGQYGVGDAVGHASENADQVRLERRHRQRERGEVALADDVIPGEHVVESSGKSNLALRTTMSDTGAE